MQIGLIQESAGHLPEAVLAYQALERAAPTSTLAPEARLHLATSLARLGRKGEAEGLLRELAAKGSEATAPGAALELATIQLESQHPEAALTTLEGALKRYPTCTSVPALEFRAAEALEKLKRPAEAEARYLKVAEGFPEDAWADDALVRAAQSALDRGDFATASRLAGRFPAKFGQSVLRSEARLIEARAAASSGRPKDAVAILEALVAGNANNSKAAGPSKEGSAVGGGSAKKGDAPALAPALAQSARYELAMAYKALGRSAAADAVLAELARGQAGPITADAQFLVGQSQVEAGRYAEAVGPLEGYLAANPRGEVAEYAMAHLVMARLGLGQPEAAWKMLAALGAEFPGSKSLPSARLRVAEAALTARQAERAAEQFRLVAGAAKAGQDGAAAGDGKPAEVITPALRARAYRGLGRAMAMLGKSTEAAAAFKAALELAPGESIAPEVALEAARALDEGHQTEAALEAYSQVQVRYAKSTQAAQAGLARARLLGKAGRHAEACSEFELGLHW